MSEDNNKDEFIPKTEDEIREDLTNEFGLDPDDEKDAERLNKLVAREVENEKKLSTAIKQKQSHRSKAQTLESKLREAGIDPETGEKKSSKSNEDKRGSDEPTEREKQMMKELDDLKMEQAGSFSEAVQDEIRTLAKMKGLTYKQAAQSSYIKHLIQTEEEEQRNADASISGGRDGGAKKRIADAKPEDIAKMSDEDYEAWKEKNCK